MRDINTIKLPAADYRRETQHVRAVGWWGVCWGTNPISGTIGVAADKVGNSPIAQPGSEMHWGCIWLMGIGCGGF
jgi:hypothetical protein